MRQWGYAFLGALMALGVMWGRERPQPQPTEPVAVAPAVAPRSLPAVAPPDATEPAKVVPLAPARSNVMDVTLRQAWVCYGQGNFAGARQLALVTLEATRSGQSTPEQVAQASALLELCKEKQAAAEMRDPAPLQARQAAPPPPRRAEPPPVQAELPQPDYPQATRSQRTWRPANAQYQPRPSAVSYTDFQRPVMPGSAVMPGYPVVPGFAAVPGYPGPGGGPTYLGPQGPVPYPAGRGPGVCPNFAVVDQCECHQWEARQRRGTNFYPDRSRQVVSNIGRMRRAESMLGRGGF